MAHVSAHYTYFWLAAAVIICDQQGVVAAAAAAPAIRPQEASLLQLKVNSSDSSYEVWVRGEPWLQSSSLRVFVNGEWHGLKTTTARPPPPPSTCAPGKPNTDIAHVGSVYKSFPNATDASCCAACIALPRACNAWVRSTATQSHDRIPVNTCFLIEGARGYKPSSTRTAHIVDSSAPSIPQITGTLRMNAPASQPQAGSDRFGSYSDKVMVEWLAISSAGKTTSFTTSFRTYSDGRTAIFEQEIASGATHTNHQNVTFADGVSGQMATIEPYPFLQFPAFNTSDPHSIFAREGRAGFTTWHGTMVEMHGPFAGAPKTSDMGLSGGPVVIFDGFENGGGNSAIVVSPATHFKGATMLRWEDDWVVGMSGEITEVPAGFSHSTILVAGGGVTETMDYYGSLMRKAYNTSKMYDRVVERVGYWTDNGAYYYGDAYPQHHDVPGDTQPDYNLTCCTKAKLMAAKEALDKSDVPIAYLQLDDWWYHGPHPVKNFHGVKCVSKWELPEDTYPGGLNALRADYKAPFLLYGPYFCVDNQWNQTLYPQGADAGVPPPQDSFSFYKRVFEYVHAHGGVGYEVDFMSNLFIDIPEFRRTLDASTGWQAGMNRAGIESKTTIQFCMMQPSDLLNSLQFDAATNGRASGDYAGSGNWNVGGSSLLFWAMGMRPSKDNFWSGDGQKRQMGFHQVNPGTNGELNAILATMSRGPVGPSDGAGQHNATRLMRTCTADGTILQPERPMVPIDATYRAVLSPAERQLNSAAVWSSFSCAAESTASASTCSPAQFHVLGVDVNSESTIPVFASDMYPTPRTGCVFAVRDWHRSPPCTAGLDAVASGCVRLTEGNGGDALVKLDAGMSWPSGTHTTQLWTVTILEDKKVTLLGELDKFVPLSSERFSEVEYSASGGLQAMLTGRPGEVVHVTALRPNNAAWIVVVDNITIGAGGTAKLSV